MKQFWNDRYKKEEYAYGEEPNVFFKESLNKLPKGKILLPCEGEGRNAVYAAGQKWKVTAFDQSEEAKNKAIQLSIKKGVTIDFQLADAAHFNYGKNQYDAIALIYAHFPENLRKKVHSSVIKALKVGGTLILEGFNSDQIKFNSGGPKDIEMLFTEEIIKKDFKALETVLLKSLNVELNEGKYHKGKASIIRYIGKKTNSP